MLCCVTCRSVPACCEVDAGSEQTGLDHTYFSPPHLQGHTGPGDTRHTNQTQTNRISVKSYKCDLGRVDILTDLD